MKELIRKVAASAGYSITRTAPVQKVSGDARIQAVCEYTGIKRLEPVAQTEFLKTEAPLFPDMTKVPEDFSWKAHASAKEAVFNRSMGVYFSCEEKEDGCYLTDGHEGSPFFARYRRIYSVVKDFLGGSLEGKTVLDIGCSSGYYSLLADRLGAGKVIGIDARPEHEEQFRLLHQMSGASDRCEYRHIDMEFGLEQMEETYDLVLAQGVMYHTFDHPRFLRNMKKLTRNVLVLECACSGQDNELCRAVIENPKELRESIHGPVLFPSLRWMIEIALWTGFREVYYMNFPSDLPPNIPHETLCRAMLVCIR